MAEISVIIPCYNVEKWIDRCLECVINQTIGLDKIEIICVDDCSTDGTVARLEEWEAKYPENIMIVRCEINARQGAARNIGMQYASGDYLAFLDSDDWIERDYLDKLYARAKKGNYEIVACGYKRDFSKELTYFSDTQDYEEKNIEVIVNTDNDRRQLIMDPKLQYSCWGKLIQKNFLINNELFFPEHLTYEDASWGSLVHLYVNRAYIISEPLYHYFVNDVSTVLKTNSNHHLDCITIQTRVWSEYFQRGFMDKYKSELEIEHIYSGYLAGMKMAILRYEKPDYNVYLLLRELMIERIGNYKDNPYIKQGCLAELHMLMLTALDTTLSKSQFYEFAENIKRIGI